MTFLTVVAVINWVDVLHYPHIGNPLPGQYEGPPVVFVLLDFVMFLYLANRFVIKPLTRMAREENERFRQSIAEALRYEEQIANMETSVQHMASTLEAQKKEIDERIQIEIEIERQQIFQKTAEYEVMRKQETLKQIRIKRDLIMGQIRDEILTDALSAFRTEIHTLITPHTHPSLFQKGLESAFEKETRHES